jgi:Bacterial Ig-like domain
MTTRQRRTRVTLRQALASAGATRPPAVDRLESRVLLSGDPAAPLAVTRAVITAEDSADTAPPAQGQIAQELVPGGAILRSVQPGLPRGSAPAKPGAPASPPPLAGGAGLDIVLKRGPNLTANAQATAAFEQAAVFFETIFSDPVTVVVDAEIAPLGPGVIGSTGAVQFFSDYATLRSDVTNGRAANEAIAGSIPTDAQLAVLFPADAGNPFSIDGGIANRATLLALGVPAAELPGARSAYDPSVFRDMNITFSSSFPFDYDRSNGIGAGLVDFIGVAIHEIAHGLGFTSEVDTVDFLLGNPQFSREVSLSPMDLFRLRPGEGQANFTTNARVLATGNAIPNQVFYDGGLFNPAGIGIPGLTMGDIPMSTGVARGDGRQGSHWKDNSLTGVQIGIMDPTAAGPALQFNWTTADNRAMGLIGWDADTTAPAVASGTFLFESAPDRLRYVFNEGVQLSLGTPDLLVQRLEPGGPVTVSPSSFTYDAASNTATFTFSGALPQGNYRATLRAAGVSDFAGNAVAADHVLNFFALAGDLNRDRAVNGTDFAILAGNFGRTGMTFAQGDLTGDGSVNGSDFAILAGNFGRSVPAPAAVVAVAAPARRVPASPADSRPVTPVARRPAPRPAARRMNPFSLNSA